jgi:hypothetical protein
VPPAYEPDSGAKLVTVNAGLEYVLADVDSSRRLPATFVAKPRPCPTTTFTEWEPADNAGTVHLSCVTVAEMTGQATASDSFARPSLPTRCTTLSVREPAMKLVPVTVTTAPATSEPLPEIEIAVTVGVMAALYVMAHLKRQTEQWKRIPVERANMPKIKESKYPYPFKSPGAVVDGKLDRRPMGAKLPVEPF